MLLDVEASNAATAFKLSGISPGLLSGALIKPEVTVVNALGSKIDMSYWRSLSGDPPKLMSEVNRVLLAGWISTRSDYRASVCVFLYGSNDGNNKVVPIDVSGYAAYAKARGVAAAVGLTLQQLSLALLNGGAVGLHGALAPLAAIWNQGHLAIQANVGSLVKPLTKAQFNAAGALVPSNLFSHSDQQMQWQTAFSGGVMNTGWPVVWRICRPRAWCPWCCR